MQRLDSDQIVLEHRRQGSREGGEPVWGALSRTASLMYSPLPSRRLVTTWVAPSMSDTTAVTASRVMTTGTLIFLAAPTAWLLPCAAKA